MPVTATDRLPNTATRPFRCGHPRVPANTYTNGRCVICSRSRAQATYEPVPCATCSEPLGSGRHTGGCHIGCEPTTCTCLDGRPDGLGECGSCHRLVLSHSWHNGRPEQ